MSVKTVVFRGRVLPALLTPPQLAITFIFFLWPPTRWSGCGRRL